jgi:microcystin-dependent protein
MPDIGEIRMFAGNFAPRGWALCKGQILSISENEALFSILSTIYGGDGVTTFALPNLQSRIPVGSGQGPGLPTYLIGEPGGTETNTLTVNNIPHSHAITGSAAILVSSEDGHRATPVADNPAVNGDNIYSTTTDNSQMASAVVSLTADNTGSQAALPVENVQPYLAINYIIALEGDYPTRN